MSITKALTADPRFYSLGDRKAAAAHNLAKEIDAILAGDTPYPSHWERIIDICRQEVGIKPTA